MLQWTIARTARSSVVYVLLVVFGPVRRWSGFSTSKVVCRRGTPPCEPTYGRRAVIRHCSRLHQCDLAAKWVCLF